MSGAKVTARTMVITTSTRHPTAVDAQRDAFLATWSDPDPGPAADQSGDATIAFHRDLDALLAATRAEAVAPVVEVLRDLVAMSARCKFAGCTTIALWRDPFDGLVCDTHRSAFDSGFENMPAVEALPRADALRAAMALLAEHKEGT